MRREKRFNGCDGIAAWLDFRRTLARGFRRCAVADIARFYDPMFLP